MLERQPGVVVVAAAAAGAVVLVSHSLEAVVVVPAASEAAAVGPFAPSACYQTLSLTQIEQAECRRPSQKKQHLLLRQLASRELIPRMAPKCQQ